MIFYGIVVCNMFCTALIVSAVGKTINVPRSCNPKSDLYLVSPKLFLILLQAIYEVLTNSIHDRKHKEGIKPLVESGIISLGGPTLVSHPTEGEDPKINGSGLLVRGNSIEEIHALLEKDAYAVNGVWDIGRVSLRGPSFIFCIPCISQQNILPSLRKSGHFFIVFANCKQNYRLRLFL